MSIAFDATNDFIDYGSSAGLDNLSSKTISFWVNLNQLDSTYRGLIGKNATDSTFGWRAYFVDSEAADTIIFQQGFSTLNGRWRMPLSVITTAVWHHIALTHSDRTSTAANPLMYLNGVSQTVTELSAPAGTATDDAAFSITSPLVQGSFVAIDGRLEDIRIFGRILDSNEILSLANGYRGPLGGEVLWIRANGPNGNLTTGTANVFDMSGNGNHGTPQDGSSYVASFAPRTGTFIGG